MGWFEQMRIGCEERVLAGLGWMARQRGGAEGLPPHLTTGIDGENAAFPTCAARVTPWWRGAGRRATCPVMWT